MTTTITTTEPGRRRWFIDSSACRWARSGTGSRGPLPPGSWRAGSASSKTICAPGRGPAVAPHRDRREHPLRTGAVGSIVSRAAGDPARSARCSSVPRAEWYFRTEWQVLAARAAEQDDHQATHHQHDHEETPQHRDYSTRIGRPLTGGERLTHRRLDPGGESSPLRAQIAVTAVMPPSTVEVGAGDE